MILYGVHLADTEACQPPVRVFMLRFPTRLPLDPKDKDVGYRSLVYVASIPLTLHSTTRPLVLGDAGFGSLTSAGHLRYRLLQGRGQFGLYEISHSTSFPLVSRVFVSLSYVVFVPDSSTGPDDPHLLVPTSSTCSNLATFFPSSSTFHSHVKHTHLHPLLLSLGPSSICRHPRPCIDPSSPLIHSPSAHCLTTIINLSTPSTHPHAVNSILHQPIPCIHFFQLCPSSTYRNSTSIDPSSPVIHPLTHYPPPSHLHFHPDPSEARPPGK